MTSATIIVTATVTTPASTTGASVTQPSSTSSTMMVEADDDTGNSTICHWDCVLRPRDKVDYIPHLNIF